MKKIDMPYDTDSELQGFRYTIPEGYEAEIVDGEVIIKKVESEDERVRSWLYELVSCLTLEMNWKKSVLSWLEKQKESLHIPETCKENGESFTDEDERIRKIITDSVFFQYGAGVEYRDVLDYLDKLEKQKEQKLVEQKVSRAQIHHELLQNGTITMEEYLKLTENLYFPKEHKPVDPSDDELQRHQDELYDFKVFAAKQAKEHHISFVHDFEWNNFCAEILFYFNEQKPVEWSKEDEKMRKAVLDEIENQIEIMPDADDMDSDDQDRYNELISMSVWMEDLPKCREFRWKPSEEQMKALQRASTNEYLSAKQFDILVSLYEQLKKLV